MTSRKIECASQDVRTEVGEAYSLVYEIIVDEFELFGSVIETYGVAIHMVGAGRARSREIHAITVKADEIERIVRLLSRGTVFPDDLEETLENILN